MAEERKAQRAAVRSQRKAPDAAADASANLVRRGATPPAWLSDKAREIWDRLAPVLVQAKLLSEADELTFARYCRNFATWLDLRAQLDATSYTYETESDHQKGVLRRADPAFVVADRLERQLLAAENNFGLNPAERQRIFVARAQAGGTGDLFPTSKPAPKPEAQASQPASAAEPIRSPIGALN